MSSRRDSSSLISSWVNLSSKRLDAGRHAGRLARKRHGEGSWTRELSRPNRLGASGVIRARQVSINWLSTAGIEATTALMGGRKGRLPARFINKPWERKTHPKRKGGPGGAVFRAS